MQTLKELVTKVYTEFQTTDWAQEYPDLTDIHILSDTLEDIALDSITDFVPKSQLKEFIEASEQNYTEDTFKKFIPNYEEFLNSVEQEFYNELLMWLAQ